MATLPGNEFGRPANEMTLRLAYVDFDGARALSAYDELENKEIKTEFLEMYCPNVINGINQLCDWLK